MIKVCHVTSVHPVEDNRIYKKECRSLAENGYDVTLVQQGGSYEKDGVHLAGFGEIASSRMKRMIFTARAAYRKALEVDADVYHLHDPELLPYALKLKKRGKKVIFDSHEKYSDLMYDKPYLPVWSARMVGAVYSAFEGYILKRIDGVVFPCLKDGKHPFEGMCSHITTVNNTARKEELSDKYDPNIQKYDRSIVYIGSLSQNRGVTNTILAAAKSDAVFYLGGNFATAEYQMEVEALPEYANVRYLGSLNRNQVLDLLQHSQIGIATLLNVGQYNQFDNLATKVYEYMSLALPVVLSKSPFNQKMIDTYQFGICVDPDNPQEIADAIRWLLDHPEEARAMGENGRRAVETEFNWKVEEEKLLALYEEILK